MPESQHTKSSLAGRIVLIVLFSLIALIVAGYCAGSYYFSSHFLPNTTVNGSDVSLMSVQELKERIDSRSDGFAIKLTGNGLDTSIQGKDFDLISDGTSYSEQAIGLVPHWYWPMEFNKEHSYQVDEGISFDEKKLAKLIEGILEPFNAQGTPTTDATVIYNAEQAKYTVQPEALGTQIDPKLTTQLVTAAATGLVSEVALDERQLFQPNVLSDDPRLAATIERANGFMSGPLSVTVDGAEVATIDPSILQPCIRIEEGGFKAVFDGGPLANWAQTELAQKLNTVGTQRSFTRTDGKQITVAGGVYGWTIDGFQLAATITNNLDAGIHAAVEVPMLTRGSVWQPGGREWGRYVDCDLAEQYARFYDDAGAIIWESPIVSGNTTTDHATPEGIWVVNAKMTKQILIGLDEDHNGEPDYKTPVDYWMPFVANLVAFHDAGWRGSFGGSIYTYDGSHGCVNLPYDKAVELFGIIREGDVVVTHR